MAESVNNLTAIVYSVPQFTKASAAVVLCETAWRSGNASIPGQSKNQVLLSLERLEEQHTLLTEHPLG